MSVLKWRSNLLVTSLVFWIVFTMLTACKNKKGTTKESTSPIPITEQEQPKDSEVAQDELSQLKHLTLQGKEQTFGPIENWFELPVTHKASLNQSWYGPREVREARSHYVEWYGKPIDSTSWATPEGRLTHEMRLTCLYLVNNPPLENDFISWTDPTVEQVALNLETIKQQWDDVYLIQTLQKQVFIHIMNSDQNVGLLDLNGNEVIPVRYQYIATLGNVLVVQENDSFGLMSVDGNWIHEPFTNSFPIEAPFRFYLKDGWMLRM